MKENLGFKELYKKMHQGRISFNELQEIVTALKAPANAEEKILEAIKQELKQAASTDTKSLKEKESLDRVYGKICAQLPQQKIKKYSIKKLLPYLAAACLLFVLSIALWLGQLNYQVDELALVNHGSNKAVITLADGKQIALNELQNTVVVGEQLTYADGTTIDATTHAGQQLTLSVPKGGTYNIVLADGTKVWLNSDSKLNYPSKFDLHKREVELEGEGYFEVKAHYKDSHTKSKKVPFLIKTKGYDVEVLGTAFNLSAYPEDKHSKVTLVEGSVGLKLPKQPNTYVIKPSQQATIQGMQVQIKTVSTDSYTSWKDGLFNFNDERLADVLTQIARWYAIDINYQQEAIKNLKFEGIVPRYEKLSEIIKLLEQSGEVKFKIHNNTLTVQEQKQ